jgi:hypothetical protein
MATGIVDSREQEQRPTIISALLQKEELLEIQDRLHMGMSALGHLEILRNQVAIFKSSQHVWGMIPDKVKQTLGNRYDTGDTADMYRFSEALQAVSSAIRHYD